MKSLFTQPSKNHPAKVIWFFLLLGALLASSCSPKATDTGKSASAEGPKAKQAATDLNRLSAVADSMANLFIAAGDVPGLSVVVARNGEVVFSKAYGKADVGANLAATPETAYGITSISKQFAAATVLHLVEKKRISLQDPISKYLPEYPLQGRQVTVRQLMNHTSGTPSMRNTSSQPDKDWFSKDLSFKEMLTRFGKEPFEFEPGQRHSYNNFAYLLLGEIIARVTGKPWAEYLQKEMLQPLGINNTVAADTKRPAPNSAKSYLMRDKQPVEAPFVSRFVLGASGDLYSTVGDLVKWSSLLHTGKVISLASVRQMTAPTVLTNRDTVLYGYGLNLGELGGHQKFYHGGTRPWGGYLAYYPATGLSIAVLTNSAGTGREKAEKMEEALARQAMGIKNEGQQLTAEEMARYVGTYTLIAGTRTMDVKVFTEGGQLKVQPEGQQVGQLLSNGNHAFTHAADTNIKVDFQVENGRAESMTLHQRGRSFPGKRKI